MSSLLLAEEEIRVDTELPWKAAKKSCLDSFAQLDSGSLEDGSIDISDVGFDRQAVYFRTQNSLCHCTPARRFESRFGGHVFKMLEKGSPGLSPLSSMPLGPFAIPVLGGNRGKVLPQAVTVEVTIEAEESEVAAWLARTDFRVWIGRTTAWPNKCVGGRPAHSLRTRHNGVGRH